MTGKVEEMNDGNRARLVEWVLDDAEMVFAELLERQELDEACDAEELCGDEWCRAVGCIADKLARARAARLPASGKQEE